MKKSVNKISLLILCIVLIATTFPNLSFADEPAKATHPFKKITYDVDGVETDAVLEKIGIWTYVRRNKPPIITNAYIIKLPKGAKIKSVDFFNWAEIDYDKEIYTPKKEKIDWWRVHGKKTLSKGSVIECISNEVNYIKDEQFDYKTNKETAFAKSLNNIINGKPNPNEFLTLDEGKKIKTSEVVGVLLSAGSFVMKWQLIIQIDNDAETDKSKLEAILKSCPDLETDELYYHENDRYRGGKGYDIKVDNTNNWEINEAFKLSRWRQFQDAYKNAEDIYKDPNAIQKKVNKAAEDLEKAKKALIPKTEINATALYEKYRKYTSPIYWSVGKTSFVKYTSEYSPMDESNTTPESLQRFNAGVSELKRLLDSLFDTEGNPTGENKSSDGELVKAITDAIAEADAAYENLDMIIDNKNRFDNSAYLWSHLISFGNGYYDISKLEKDEYTPESFERFEKACDEVKKYCEKHAIPVSGKASYNELYKMQDLYEELHLAYQHLREKKESIDVKIKVIDNVYSKWFGKNEVDDSPVYFETQVKLGENRNYSDIKELLPADFRSARERGAHTAYAIFINGILLEDASVMNIGERISGFVFTSTGAEGEKYNICLKDGDEILFARLRQPTRETSSGTGPEPAFVVWKMKPHIKVSRMSVESNIVQGEEVEFSFETAGAAPMNTQRGKYSPMSGAELYVSPKASKDKEGILRTTKATKVKTDLDGKLKYRFLDPGYYRVCISPPRVGNNGSTTEGDADYMPGMICPAVQEIYVKPSSNENIADEIKKEFFKELRKAYERYPKDSYSSESFDELTKIYETAIKSIKDSEKLIDAQAEMVKAIEKMFNLQEEVALKNDETVRDFLLNLAPLPDDASKLDKGQMHLMKALIAEFEKLSDYQKTILSKGDREKYDALVSAYGKDGSTLPEPRKYKITYKIVGDTEEDTKVLEQLLALYIKDLEAGNVYKRPVINQSKDKLFFEGHVAKDGQPDLTSLEAKYSKEVYPLQQLIGRPYVYILSKYAEKVEGAVGGGEGQEGTGRLRINGKEYDPIDINVTFGNALKLSRLEKQSGGELKLVTKTYMPYEDLEVTFIMTEKKAQSSSTNKIKEGWKLNIESQFEQYRESDYTPENWEKLVKAKDDVKAEIDAITGTLYGIEKYYEKALRAMAAIPRKEGAAGSGSADENLSGAAIPDFGATVGRVHIIVENQTFKGSDAAWHGRLIDGWYELEERDTMMTSILKALQKKDCTWSTGSQGKATSWGDYNIAYLASIQISDKTKGDGSDFVVNDRKKRLGEFSGERGSGWMGTLNDWFTNEGFSQFSAGTNDPFKKIMDGDEIHVMFTQNLGVDLGGTWGNSDTRLKALSIEGKGTLSPAFSPNVTEYVYALENGVTSGRIKVTPTAMNKNYLVGTFLNGRQNKESIYTEFRRNGYIPVEIGDKVNIIIGHHSWPSMNKQGAEAREYRATEYKIKVIRSLTDYLGNSILSLPSTSRLTLTNYSEYGDLAAGLLKTYENMSKEDKAKIKNIDVLQNFLKKVKFFEEISVVKNKLKVLPASNNLSDDEVKASKAKIEDADKAYRALTAEQQRYIVIADAENYNKLVERLGKLKVSTSAKSITANEQAPVSPVVEPKAEVTGDKASAKLDEKAVNQVITEAAKAGEKKIIIEPQGTKDAKEINVSIPKASAEMLAAKKDMSVSVETKSGQVNIPAQAMASIVKEAKGSDISINIALKEKSAVKDVAASKLMENKDAVAVEVKIESAGKGITKFASPIEILLPVNDKFVEGKAYPVMQISADGTKSNPIGKCVKIGGKLYIKLSTDHLSTFVVSPEAVADTSFTDIQGHWAYEAIKYAEANKLMAGVSADKFNPDGTLSRAMLATILYRVEKEPKVTEEAKYSDVAKGMWYTDAIAWASHEGIVTGYSKDIFAPNDNITREQMAAMLKRYSEYKKLDTKKSKDLANFKDAGDISAWAGDAIRWAAAENLIHGRTADTVVPKGTATRAEAATILKSYMENIVKAKPAENKADAKADDKTKQDAKKAS